MAFQKEVNKARGWLGLVLVLVPMLKAVPHPAAHIVADTIEEIAKALLGATGELVVPGLGALGAYQLATAPSLKKKK